MTWVVAATQVLRPDGSEATLPAMDGSVAASLVCIAFRAGAEVSPHPCAAPGQTAKVLTMI